VTIGPFPNTPLCAFWKKRLRPGAVRFTAWPARTKSFSVTTRLLMQLRTVDSATNGLNSSIKSQDERDLLAAHCNSRCSLFAIISADAVAYQLKLRDVLEPAVPEVALTDINLSKCSAAKPGDLLFTRVLHVAEIGMSGGFFFAFGAIHRVGLLNAYEARMRAVAEKERSQRTYVFFLPKEPGVGDAPSLPRRCVNDACLAPRRSRQFRAT
jgi:hypothetical protein